MAAPVPFDEKKIENPNWEREPWDRRLPKQLGFVTDVVYALRGNSTTTAFCVWSALWAMASVIKREAWIAWPPDRLYSNIYVILVAPPAICKKGTVINFVSSLMSDCTDRIGNANIRLMKKIKVIRNRATKEYIMKDLMSGFGRSRPIPLHVLDPEGRPTNEPLRDSNGQLCTYRPTSECAIVATELGVLLGKERFNEGLIEFLVDIYDPMEVWDAGTGGEGLRRLRRTCTSLIGATQPDAIRNSLPKAAHGEGFLSRTIVVYRETVARRRYKPFTPEGAPDKAELSARLAWIAENTQGEYTLSKEADAYYHEFYDVLIDKIEAYPELGNLISRMDINLLKVAFLIRAHRYEPGNIIERQDVVDAKKLIEDAMGTAPAMIEMVRGGPQLRKYKTVSAYIKKHSPVDRSKLLRHTSHDITAADVTMIVNEMAQRELITISVNGNAMHYSTQRTSEVYTWKWGTIHEETL